MDCREFVPMELPLGDGTHQITSLKARAVMVDTEDGVVSETLRGPLGGLFESSQVVTDVSGAGNNWWALPFFPLVRSVILIVFLLIWWKGARAPGVRPASRSGGVRGHKTGL
jgi:hypothetical protein